MIDELDREILFELLQDCRKPLSKIAKAVNLPQQTLSYRIKKLEKEGIIKKYTININYPKLGFARHSLYLDLKSVKPEEVDKYLKQITDISEVSCCYMLHDISQWKIYVSVWTKTVERYDEIQTLIVTRFKDYLKNYLSFQSIKSYTYFARRLNTKKKAKVDIKEESPPISIKESDWKLIKLLQLDSRTGAVELSKKLKISVNTIMRRLQFLKKKGIIERCYPILNMNKIGYKEYTFISRIDPSHSKDLEKFIDYAKSDPRFVIIIKAVGYVNLYYAFLSKDDQELHEIMTKIDELLGKATLEKYKIEVAEMLH
jgi:DNA-binding Lrp family transcriptional regulator